MRTNLETDTIDAKQRNTILAYVHFLEAHPYCEYRNEAEKRILDMKGDLLNDMKRFPFKYNREDMYKHKCAYHARPCG